MDKLNTLLGFLVALSLATERIVETIKGTPPLSWWLASETQKGAWEQCRQACIHVVAIVVGTFLARETLDQFSTAFGQRVTGWWVPLVLGAMASGGSGIWNSALDTVREISKQKQLVTDELKKNPSKITFAQHEP